MPVTALEMRSRLTDRYQTTVPAAVRKALGLGKHDTLRYSIMADGAVVLGKAEFEEPDPVMEKFLEILAKDISAGARHVRPLDAELKERIEALVGDVEIDLEERLPDEGA